MQDSKPKHDRDGYLRCRVCGCTEREACAGGCGWEPGEHDLCTVCAAAIEAVRGWMEHARRANKAALWREVEPPRGKVRTAGGEE